MTARKAPAPRPEPEQGPAQKIRVGINVRHATLPGLWYVWSQAPEHASWWLAPRDEKARAVRANAEHYGVSFTYQCLIAKTSDLRRAPVKNADEPEMEDG